MKLVLCTKKIKINGNNTYFIQAWKKGKEDVDNGVKNAEADDVQKNNDLANSSLDIKRGEERLFREPTQTDLDLIASLRTKYRAGEGRNIAFSKGNIGGDNIDLECVSGSVTPQNVLQKGNFVPPSESYYTGVLGYENHTEQKIIEYLRSKYINNPDVVGEIEIVSERAYCPNCVDIVDQFQAEFQNITVIRVEVVK